MVIYVYKYYLKGSHIMFRLPTNGSMSIILPDIPAFLKSKLKKIIKELKSISIYTEDLTYKRQFIGKYMSHLHKKHSSELYVNCIYCANLARTACHKHCLKCKSGTYLHCSPLLPGILYSENKHPYNMNNTSIPWLYKDTCKHFIRLEANNYFKNFKVPFSWVTIYNFEVLDGLLNGLSYDRKPCHVCASIDYQIYKDCRKHEGFDNSTPCTRIASQIASYYTTPFNEAL